MAKLNMNELWLKNTKFVNGITFATRYRETAFALKLARTAASYVMF